MNKDVLNELEEIKKQLDEINKKYHKIEYQYGYMDHFKLVSHILNKLGIDDIRFSIEEMEKDQSVYICNHDAESGMIRVYKESEGTRE